MNNILLAYSICSIIILFKNKVFFILKPRKDHYIKNINIPNKSYLPILIRWNIIEVQRRDEIIASSSPRIKTLLLVFNLPIIFLLDAVRIVAFS